MESQMPVSPEKIKALRDAKAWSQAHLAEAAGLSLRTVQRVEAEGTASAETRLALAGALGVPIESLNAAPAAPPVAPEVEPDADQVPAGARVGVFALSAAGLLFAMWLGRRLPPQVASHFGAAGEPNGWMSRDGFVGVMVAMLGVLPIVLQAVLALALRFGGVNIPNARYWLAPPRRAAAVRSLHHYVAWLAVGTSLFMGWICWQVAAVNRVSGAHPMLDSESLLIGLGVLLVAMIGWITAIGQRFKR